VRRQFGEGVLPVAAQEKSLGVPQDAPVPFPVKKSLDDVGLHEKLRECEKCYNAIRSPGARNGVMP